jgi:hypothetical protein
MTYWGGLEEPKKETLEEVAENFWLNDDSMTDNDRISYVNGFLACAKWQQERSYSEEEVLQLLQKALTHQDDGETGSLVTVQGKIRTANFYSWFERFKKK